MHKIFEIVFIKHFTEVGDNHTNEESEPPNAEILVNTHISFSETDVKVKSFKSIVKVMLKVSLFIITVKGIETH
jgi:hypothetical protein